MRRIGVVVNGVTGRMGYRQHLVRSLLAIREQGGVELRDGSRLMPEPVLVGRREERVRAIAERHGLDRWTTDLHAALDDAEIYFDAQVTPARAAAVRAAIAAGKHVYTEKPTAESLWEALALARLADEAGVRHGVVQDKLFLPGLLKLRRLVEGGFFGRILSVRGEFGYWIFEGDWQAPNRPSWNYRAEEGGGIALDMLCHWRGSASTRSPPTAGASPRPPRAVEREIARARVLGFHIDDWVVPLPEGALLGRGLPGEGHADLPRLYRAICDAGYTGPIEVEVLSERVGALPGDDVLARLVGSVDSALAAA